MGWNLFGVPYLCSYTTERMSIDHILYTYDPEASRFVSINLRNPRVETHHFQRIVSHLVMIPSLP